VSGGLETRGLSSLQGPLAVIEAVDRASLYEEVEITGEDGRSRLGRVLAVDGRFAVVEVFGETAGLSLAGTRVRWSGRPFRMGVGRELLGRVFDGVGRPRDDLPPPAVSAEVPVDGAPINPVRREYPRDFLETGISAIDGLNTVVLGQKLPLFTVSGLPHDALIAQIVRQARAPGVESFVVVFAALGLPRDSALRYEKSFRRSGALRRVVTFLNFADDPPAERLVTPRCALTVAEHFAFELGLHVLVVLNDITSYGEALREVAAARGDVPGRKGYPGYLYSDLASLFERAGRIRGRAGSLTQIPVVTLPAGDLTHPIPDLTGYVTEGQIILDRELDRRGISPPIAVLASLSRLMDDGIGPGRTREDHPAVARQLYAAYARAARSRELAAIIGRDELSEGEKRYLDFGDALETRFLCQRFDEFRTVAETLDRAWALLRTLPPGELGRIPREILERYGSPPNSVPA
jgi:V/A-type H+-transporting ATPase subunit B